MPPAVDETGTWLIHEIRRRGLVTPASRDIVSLIINNYDHPPLNATLKGAQREYKNWMHNLEHNHF